MKSKHLLKFTLTLSVFTLLSSLLSAQTVKVYGYVWDQKAGMELPYATISASKHGTNDFVGVVTDINGFFSLQLSQGTYKISVSFLGYQTYIKDNVKVLHNDTNISLGKIFLKSDAKVLDGAKVEGEKETMKLDVDRKVFEVQDNPMTTGGTAVDVLNQIPTVDVDMNGNISLRGSSDVQIYINGKPTSFGGADKQSFLQQIPAANIERIELINNPSAKYDAEGTAGIINIILKSSNKIGWNASVTAGYGTFDRYNGSASFSYGNNKLKFSTTYGYRNHHSVSKGTTQRLNLLEDTTYFLLQNSETNRGNLSNTWNGNLDYEITPKTTLSFNWLGSLSTNRNPETVFYSFEDPDFVPLYEYYRNGADKRNSSNGELGFSFNHHFDKEKKHNLLFLANISSSKSENNSQYNQDELGLYKQLQNTKTNTDNILPLAQLDYVLPIGGKSVFESGIKFTMRKIGNDFYADTMNFDSHNYDVDRSLTNNFIYSEVINAAYVNYSQEFKWFKVKAGVRAEQSIINGDQKVGNLTFSRNYINLFPSVFWTKEISKGQDFQLSYSRRIQRPWISSLNPFAEQTDPYNLRKGNPYLNPELIDAYEATYFVSKKGDFISGTIYYRQVNGEFQRYRIVDENGIATMTFTNLDVARNIGLEGIFRKKIRNLSTTLNFNLFREQVSGNLTNIAASATNYSWFGKLLASYKVNKSIDVQASYFYRGKVTYVQGTMNPMHSLDLGFKMEVFDKRGSIAINLTDVFNTREFSIVSNGVNFESESTWKWQSRVLTLNFTYKFGSLNDNIDKKPKRRMDDGGSGGDEMDF
ncbi:MAG: TonB-dependent receptor [Bacteroidetes bacterium]|nr:TonB-dependent receptor [Bacteroidota bacterium]